MAHKDNGTFAPTVELTRRLSLIGGDLGKFSKSFEVKDPPKKKNSAKMAAAPGPLAAVLLTLHVPLKKRKTRGELSSGFARDAFDISIP